MLNKNAGVYLQLPNDSDRRVLLPGTVVSVDGSVYTVELEEANLTVEAGQEVLIYYETNRRFLRQTARIDATMTAEPKTVIGFETIGKPVSAESRQCYRVSTLMADLTAEIDNEENCPLVDVSASGFSVIATQRHKVGQTVNAVLAYENQRFDGTAHVMSLDDLDGRRVRYGLHCVEDKRANGNLPNGLQQISVAVQRRQLRRIAGRG